MNQDNSPSFNDKFNSFRRSPTVVLVGKVAGMIAVAGISAFAGYKYGKSNGRKDGIKVGETIGRGQVLGEIGIQSHDIPTVAAAWAEGRELTTSETMGAMSAVPA